MSKPYVLVHMMMSLDGRIDCGMTIQLQGNDHYYATLNSLDAPSRISGRVTAETELTGGGKFKANGDAQLGKEDFAKNAAAGSYNIVMDTKGSLLWGNDDGATQPHLIITSEQVSPEYLDYLNEKGISWIATGKEHIDLGRALEILGDKFGVQRVAVVGGGKINGGFLDAGLVDEVSVVIGPGVDGRTGQPSLFDGRPNSRRVLPLKLKDVQSYDDGTIWLRYLTK
ncbi:RibD family protein [Limosilactobacillus viscerum]|uniref:RibD family protein n=1 Tax=Limosilactobacillus viscerum TaxID=2993450 RepID=UPI0024BB24B1|nr:RibD family protein [Limosilactobacillus viscerum]